MLGVGAENAGDGYPGPCHGLDLLAELLANHLLIIPAWSLPNKGLGYVPLVSVPERIF
jgi:hypothetical protein